MPWCGTSWRNAAPTCPGTRRPRAEPPMSDLHYRGNVVDAIVAMGEDGHMFGPDICGSGGLNKVDTRIAVRTGAYDILRRNREVLLRGAVWEVTAAHYDPDTDMTTAAFQPWVDPMQRI